MKESVSVAAYDKKRQLLSLLSGIVVAYAITCAAFIGCALALTYTNLSESAVPLIVTTTCVLSVIVAGYDASRGAAGNGWLWGLAAGAAYAIILVCIGKWVSVGFTLDSRTAVIAILCLAGGGLGGVIGINFKK